MSELMYLPCTRSIKICSVVFVAGARGVVLRMSRVQPRVSCDSMRIGKAIYVRVNAMHEY